MIGIYAVTDQAADEGELVNVIEALQEVLEEGIASARLGAHHPYSLFDMGDLEMHLF